MKNKKRIFYILGIVTLIALTGCQGKEEEKNKYTGTVECENFYIASEVSGKVNKVNVSKGMKVKENDLVAQIDSKMYELQKNAAEGALEIVNGKYESLPSKEDENSKKQALGAIKQAKSAVDIQDFNISKCNIKSEKSGMIKEVLVHKGELVNKGTIIAKASDTSKKYIKIYLEESKRNKVKIGDKLNLYYKEKKVGEGEVNYISSESEFTPKNTQTKNQKEDTVFEVEIEILDEGNYSEGTMIDVEIN